MSVLLTTDFQNRVFSGKVRDTYRLGDVLLMVTTDRISAFDVVLPTGIPDKGHVLAQMSAFWFDATAHIVPNHLIELVEDVEQTLAWCGDGYCPVYPPELAGRSLIVREAEPIPMECVVRGYLAGSAWAEYRTRGSINEVPLPAQLRESERLPRPLFTPSTKATSGHDRPLSPDAARALVGAELHDRLERISLELYAFAAEHALRRGIIIADTKFEFGWIDDELCLIDEALTPDSSRFWPADRYEPGRPQESFDKQYVRDWLDASGWNRQPPAPALPPDVVARTSQRYRTAYTRITGRQLL